MGKEMIDTNLINYYPDPNNLTKCYSLSVYLVYLTHTDIFNSARLSEEMERHVSEKLSDPLLNEQVIIARASIENPNEYLLPGAITHRTRDCLAGGDAPPVDVDAAPATA